MLLLTCWINGELAAATAAIAAEPVLLLLLLLMGVCGCVGLPLYLTLMAEYVPAPPPLSPL